MLYSTQVNGIFGPSIFCLHRPLDIVKGVVIDDLHCMFLGVTRHLINLWFDKKWSRQDFYVGNKVCCLMYYTRMIFRSRLYHISRLLLEPFLYHLV